MTIKDEIAWLEAEIKRLQFGSVAKADRAFVTAMLSALVDEVCSGNEALADYKRARLYRNVLQKLLAWKETHS